MRTAAYAIGALALGIAGGAALAWLVTVPSSLAVDEAMLWTFAAAAVVFLGVLAFLLTRAHRREAEWNAEETDAHLEPLRTGSSKTERRMRALFRERGQLPARTASAARRRLMAALDATRPARRRLPAWVKTQRERPVQPRAVGRHRSGPAVPQPGVAHMPVPPPVTPVESAPPPSFTEPDPAAGESPWAAREPFTSWESDTFVNAIEAVRG